MVHVGDGADGCLEHSLETESRTVLETMIWASRSWEKSGSSCSALLIRTVIFHHFSFTKEAKATGDKS